MRLLSSLLLTFLLCVAVPSYAEDVANTPIIPKPLNVMPSKIKPVQSSGTDELSKAAPEGDKSAQDGDSKALEILSPRPTYGFQNDFWSGMNRSDLVAFLSKPAVASHGRAVRDLTLRTALTPSAELSSNNNPVENIYALRLKKLVDLGSFDDAQKLYKLNESAPPTPLAAQSGIEASLGHGEIAVACLDQKTFDNALKTNTAFWSNLDTFCQALLGPVAGDDDNLRLSNAARAYIEIVKPVATTAQDINQSDLISTIALMQSGKIAGILSNSANLSLIDDKHLGILLTYAKPSAAALPLLSEGISRGLVADDKAISFITAIDLKDSSTPYGDFLKEYVKNGAAPLVTDKLLELANSTDKETLLYPLYSAPEIAFPETHKILSLRLLALTNQDIPANLAQSAYGVNESVADIQKGEEILIKLLSLQSKSGGKTTSDLLYPTLLALDYANYPQKDIKNAYDNILSLTPDGNYVMPIGDILSSLKKSADKKQMNQVVIRSLAIIDDKPLEKLHPAVLYQILEALNSAGLTEETISLTREVLGHIMKK